MSNQSTISSVRTSEVEPKNNNDKKCAPGLQYEAGSCIKLHILIEMAKAYNDGASANDTIRLHPNMEVLNPKKYKKYLLKKFNERMGDKCTTQKCWTDQGFIKQMKKYAKEELEKYTFRPNGPEGRFEWLNTININEVMRQYEKLYPEFKFLGAVPMDFDDIMPRIRNLSHNDLVNENKSKIGIVFNLDNHDQPGSHWVALYGDLNKGQIYFYDSYSVRPEKRVRTLVRRLSDISQNGMGVKNLDVDYNKIRHQYENSECGVYSINFIERMLKGEPFKQICESKTPDRKVNLERNTYFYNVNIKNT
jgi:hypothetical protein